MTFVLLRFSLLLSNILKILYNYHIIEYHPSIDFLLLIQVWVLGAAV